MFSFRLDADTSDTVADVKRAMVDMVNDARKRACDSQGSLNTAGAGDTTSDTNEVGLEPIDPAEVRDKTRQFTMLVRSKGFLP